MRKEAFPRTDRPRVVVTTDPELDDLNSMIRLLTHADEIDLRGLVYAGSECHWAGDPDRGIAPHRWPAPGETLHIETAINAYARVEDTLRVHDPRSPRLITCGPWSAWAMSPSPARWTTSPRAPPSSPISCARPR